MLLRRTLRTRRLFRDNGRALVVAMDHARVFDTVTGLKDANAVIRAAREGGADAVLTPYGSSYACSEALGSGGCWLSVDVTPETTVSIVETALRMGVDGIKVEVYPWCEPEDDFFKRFSGNDSLINTVHLATECQKWGIPLMVEAIPGGWPNTSMRTPEKVAAAARVASEAGADYVKTFYTGDPESFRTVLENCQVPVLILGGPKIDSDREILQMVREAMDAGAVGITMGRNVWGHPNITGMTAALAAIVHDDASVETAYRQIQ
ncbi:MAG: class I fructose-bisphosphate aldolase [bacterium]|jgi:fructose-bisphosphate aldolase/2-amino-3,7-dideoxy-D-threo-hept-6-ulosonate synthase